MATVKKKKKSNFVDQVVNGDYQSIFSKNNTGASSNKNVTNASTPSNKTSSTIITGSATGSLLGDDSPFLSTQKKSSFVDQVVGGTFKSIINTTPKSSKGEKETTTLSSSVGNVNEEGYKSTGKKYGDYKYQSYKERKDYEVYEKEGKYYYYDAKRKSYIPMDQAELTTPELDKKSYEEAKKQGYTGSKDTLKLADRIKLDTANLTEEEYKDYEKDLERQQEDKEEAEKRKNRVRVSGAGLKGSLGELETLFSNAGANIDDNIIEPVRDVKDNYKVGKMTEQLGLEAYKKMTGEKNDYDKIRKEYDKYVTFNEDIVNDANYLDQTIQTIPNQVGGLIAGAKGGGIGGIAGAILGGGAGAVATRTPQGTLVGAEKGAKFLGGAGYVGGQSQYTYKLEAGLQYQTLIDMGVPEDIAKKEAKDTGLFNALVEGGESILDLVSFGGLSKVKGALTKKLVEKYGEETVTSWAGKTALQNLVTEGLEEGIQEGGSIHNEKQALEQAGIERDDSKDWERIKESIIAGGLAGFLLGGGVSAVTGTAKVGVKAINEKVIKSNVNQQINAYEKETGIKLTTDEKKELLNETLTRAKEIQNTQKEPVSQQETELQKQQFVYEAKDTDSEARIKLAQTTDVLNNSKAHHELFELTSKIAEDTGTSIKFVNDSKQEMVEEKQRFTQNYAKSNGITLEEANSKLKDLTIDGFVNDKGELIVNADSPKALNVILGHETTHLFENTKEYASLQKSLFELAETRGDMKKLREDMTRLYEGTNANIDNEITSELAGEYLFTDQDFINKLSAEQPSTFKKVYDYLKHLYKTVTAQSKEARQLEQVMYKYEKAYKEFSKTTTQQSKTNLTTEVDSDTTKYHISSTFSEEIDKTLNDEMKRGSQVKARDYTPEILVNNGVKDLPMLITQKHVKSIVYTTEEANRLGLSSESNYHGLGKDLLVKSIDNMDNPLEIYKKSDNQYIIVTELTDSEGHKIIVPVKIDGKGSYNDVYIDENHIQSVYGKRNLESYLERNSFEQIYNKKGTTLNEGSQSSDISSSMDINIPYKATTVNEEAQAWYNEQLELLKGDTEGLEVLQEFFDNGKNVTPDTVEEFITDYYSTEDVKEWNDRIKKLSVSKEDIDDMVRDVKRTMEQDVIDDQYIDELIENSDSYREDENGNSNYEEVRDALMEALEKEGISGRYDKGQDKYIYDRQELAKKGYDELLNYLDKNNVNYEVSRSTEAGYVPSIYIKNAESETIYRIANHDNGYVDDFDMAYNGAYNTLYSDKDYANWKERILPKIEKEIGSLEKQPTKYSLSDIQGLENYSKDDIKNITNDYIKQKLEENDLYDVEVKEIEIHGSRGRGTAKTNSDLDVVVEYEGDVREDTLFNILNDVDDQLEIEGIKVDINPITENDTGTLKDYMKRSNEYDKEVLAKQNTKYSFSDNQGRTLSKEQQDYFKDSKVRDENGNLKVLYHGSDTVDTTIFTKDKFGNRGITFLSDDSDIADTYRGKDGRKYEFYADIKNPLIVEGDGAYWSSIDYYGDDSLYLTTNEIVEDALNGGELDSNGKYVAYDGVIFKNIVDRGKNLHKEIGNRTSDVYVVFNSNQIKNVDNTNPTSDADIRYSLSEKGTLVDGKGNDVTLEVSDTGNTNTLMAIHNLNADKLKGVLELGGFPVPSIAITNPDLVNHNQFGDISVLFDKETINPANRLNEVYDRDVWSPTFPSVEVEIDNAKLKNISKESGISDLHKDSIVNDAILRYFYEENLSDSVDRFGFEGTLDKIKNDNRMKYAYLKAKDNSFEPVTKPREFGNYSNDIYQEFLNSHGKLSDPFSMSYDEIMQYGKDVQTALKVDLDNKMSEISKYEDSPDKMAFWTRLYTDEYNKIPENYRKIDEFLRSAYNLQTYGSNATEIDQEATLKKASDTINQQEYEKWVDDNFNGIIKKKGIRNDKDLFTPSGNRRSFSQLHDDYTLRSIVNYLTKQKTVAGQEGFGAGSGFGTIQAQMSKRFNSIDEIKQYAKNRLTTSTESAEVLNALREVISDDMTKLGEYFKFDSGYYSESYDNSGYALNDFAGYKTQNISNLKKALENNNIDSNKVPIELLQKIVDDVNRLKDIPTDYFEAKPQRAVGLDEIQAVVIPNDTDTDLKQQLSDRGLYVVEYDSNIEGDRQNKINQFDDLKFSLSNQNEIAPIGNGKRIYGNKTLGVDIAPLEQKIEELSQKISDLQENIAPVSQDIVERENMNNFNTLTDEDAPTNLSDEETKELNRLNSLPFDLEGEEQSRVDELTSKQDEYGSFTLDNETPEVKNKSTIIKDLKGFGMNQQEARNLYNKIANDSNTTPEDIFDELKNYREIYEESDYYKQIRNDIKGTRLNISNIKDQITDYSNSYRMSLMGKRLILGNSGQPIDTFYQELSNNYPDVFSPEITAEADQLDAIADFLYRDDKMLVDRLSDEEITELANKIYNEIDTTERLNNTRETLYSNSNFKNLVSMLEAGEITPETYEDFLKSLPKELSTKYEPYLEVARELNASSTDKTRQKDRIRSLLDEKSIKGQETTNEPTISSNNPFDELLDKFLKRKRTKPDVAPKVEKSKVRNLVDTTKELFVNRNTEIDNLAKESGNLNIKYAGDMLNSVAGEVEGDIYTAQTDNYGHEIGKSVSGLFQEVKNKGLYDAFNDYLEQYSNIDRHSQGKGSKTPLAVSQKLVQDYEKSYPGFKKMAQDVWKYSSNIRDNLVESGLITQEFSDTLAEMYPHYVPFMENREMTNVYQDIGEAKPKGVIKYAKGGAKNLLPIEEALTKYTYASKKAVRQNQLYQQIVKTLNDKVEIGADVRSDPTELSESLYRDEKGNYLTAYVNGKQESVRISDDLYRGLKNDMESRVKDLEQRLSLVTKPLQKVSEVRRNLLTTWSPTFIITNPVKDIQDAVFNSKYTKDMLKNYPTSFVELSQAKSETAKQFLALYGSGNTQGDYSVDSGLNKGIAKKNTKFLKGISKLNNIVELAPRYAEFKASLENGTTVQEAMYNAREITTNFNRGGTITKALNRNGATFLNTSVQGFDKFVRNFSGENGAKGVASALLKAGLFGVLPGVFNELAFGGDDDDKDEDYEALPDYIKDNYYLIKTGEGDFIRIPKGRMLSVFGSASRRTIEYLNGEEDAFEGFLKNAYTQVGFNDPSESNIFTPIKQAIDNEAWYGGDLVPSRLQKLAPKEQYDASTDKLSIWLGDKLNISPYKINYVLDQYTGGIGDMVLPLITEEAQSDSDSIPEMMLAPIRDKFTANSTSDNKYASDIYTLSDKMDKATSDIKETDEYKIQDSYLYDITSQMAELYQERRDVQADTSLSKSEKYNKVQSIQEQINSLAKEGLDNYKNVQKTDNYAIVGGREFNKYTTDDGEERWGKPREDELNDLNSMGMTLYEKSSYFKAKTDISSIKDEYKDSEDYVSQKRDIIDAIKNTYLNDEQKSYLYDRYYGNTETLGIVNAIGIDFDSYLDYEYQSFTADKDSNGKSISGSKKQKVFDYINSMDIDFEQKLILAKLQYNSYDEYNYDIIDYLNNNDDISYEDEVSILKKLGFTVDEEGNIYW